MVAQIMKSAKETEKWIQDAMRRLISFGQNGTVLQMLLELEEILSTANKICALYNFLIRGNHFKFIIAFVTIV